jgi:zinc transporter ZupT
MNVDVIIQLLNLFIAGTAGVERFVALREQLTAMKNEGRDPTDAEWQTLLDGIADDSTALNANDKG